jgi:hypothetical protein
MRKTRLLPATAEIEAAKLLGLTDVPVVRVSHLSPAEQRAFAIADNRLAELAAWDHDTLAIELQSLVELDFAVEVTGFDMDEIELILHHQEEDNAGKPATSAGAQLPRASSGPVVSRSGDVWLLGPHRLACGEGADACAYAAVDDAIRHWQRFSRGAAKLAGSGQSFKEVAKARRKTQNSTRRDRSRGGAKRREVA